MRKMRMVMGTDNGSDIAEHHLGESKNFLIMDIEETGGWTVVEIRNNTSGKEAKHADEKKLKRASALFEDCSVVVAASLSPNMARMNRGERFQPVIVPRGSIEEVARLVSDNFDMIFKASRDRKAGHVREMVRLDRTKP